jgi:hypothetical protein
MQYICGEQQKKGVNLKSFVNQLSETLVSTKTAAVTAVGSVTSGTVTALNWLPEWLPTLTGVLASIAGLTLSIIVAILSVKKHRLEMKVLEKQLNDQA